MFDINFLVVTVLSLATYRLTRLFVVDTIFNPLREAVWSKWPPNHPLGYLFTCVWCMSIWSASLLVLCYTIFSTATMIFASILALSAVASLIAAHLDS
jgi:hypothetical protein